MNLNGVMALIFALFHRIFAYDVVIKQLLGLPRFQNLLLIVFLIVRAQYSLVDLKKTQKLYKKTWSPVILISQVCYDS